MLLAIDGRHLSLEAIENVADKIRNREGRQAYDERREKTARHEAVHRR